MQNDNEPKWLKIMGNKFLVRIMYPILLVIIILLVIYLSGKIGGNSNCPLGQHEEQRYDRFGDSECIPD